MTATKTETKPWFHGLSTQEIRQDRRSWGISGFAPFGEIEADPTKCNCSRNNPHFCNCYTWFKAHGAREQAEEHLRLALQVYNSPDWYKGKPLDDIRRGLRGRGMKTWDASDEDPNTCNCTDRGTSKAKRRKKCTFIATIKAMLAKAPCPELKAHLDAHILGFRRYTYMAMEDGKVKEHYMSQHGSTPWEDGHEDHRTCPCSHGEGGCTYYAWWAPIDLNRAECHANNVETFLKQRAMEQPGPAPRPAPGRKPGRKPEGLPGPAPGRARGAQKAEPHPAATIPNRIDHITAEAAKLLKALGLHILKVETVAVGMTTGPFGLFEATIQFQIGKGHKVFRNVKVKGYHAECPQSAQTIAYREGLRLLLMIPTFYDGSEV